MILLFQILHQRWSTDSNSNIPSGLSHLLQYKHIQGNQVSGWWLIESKTSQIILLKSPAGLNKTFLKMNVKKMQKRAFDIL